MGRFRVQLSGPPGPVRFRRSARRRIERRAGRRDWARARGSTCIDPASLFPWIARDKKNDGNKLTLVLTRGIGQAFVARDVDPARLAAFLA